MLYSLHVKNLALIKEQEIEFTNGMNILTGETGAGKSILIGSVNLALGARADKEMIRSGAEYALVELTFGISDEAVLKKIKEMELPLEEDGTVIISRKILPARSVCRVCGETVTLKQLRALSSLLIDIHGQNDHQNLLHRAGQAQVLDDYAADQIRQDLDATRKAYHALRDLEDRYQGMDLDEKTRLREQELASYELEEIRKADPQPGEDEELDKEYKRLSHARRIIEALSAVRELSDPESDQEDVSESIGRAQREMNEIRSFDGDLEQLAAQLDDIDALFTDFSQGVRRYLDAFSFDPASFAQIEERLNLLNHLKDKYGESLEKVLSYADEKEKQIAMLSDLDESRKHLEEEIRKQREQLLACCERLSRARISCAKELSALMRSALSDLNFLDVQFEIRVTPDRDQVTARGYDQISFMISTNPGEAIRPLEQTASGGELSRIMLALKTVLADREAYKTLIFDEIDTGISGRTAWKVSEKMGQLSFNHQIICITHLPQIAAMANTHFLIEKRLQDKRTVTGIRRLETEDSVYEVARLLGGAEITEAALGNAREMLKQAAAVRENGKTAGNKKLREEE